MCDPTYPVFRSASIVRVNPGFAPAEAVRVAERLSQANNRFCKRIGQVLDKLPGVSSSAPDPTEPTVRVRLTPAIIIDFQAIEFRWRNKRMQFRACMTTSVGDRKSKIWTRFNFIEKQKRKSDVKQFFEWAEKISSKIHEVCLEFYRAECKALDVLSQMTRTYSISIKMVSAPNPAIRKELDREFTSTFERVSDGGRRAYDLLAKELLSDSGLELPQLDSETARLVGFRYPRKSEEAANEVIPEQAAAHNTDIQSIEVVDAPPLVDDSFEALCIVHHDASGLHITGVAHETAPPEDFRRSAPHIVSGEISYEVGIAY